MTGRGALAPETTGARTAGRGQGKAGGTRGRTEGAGSCASPASPHLPAAPGEVPRPPGAATSPAVPPARPPLARVPHLGPRPRTLGSRRAAPALGSALRRSHFLVGGGGASQLSPAGTGAATWGRGRRSGPRPPPRTPTLRAAPTQSTLESSTTGPPYF